MSETTEPSHPEKQRMVTRACVLCAQLLLQHGAETAVVDEFSTRLGLALGMDSVESSISSNSIVLTTIYHKHCLTTARKSIDRGINMYVVSQVHRIVLAAEDRQIDYLNIQNELESIPNLRHANWLVVFMVGIACACFCRLAGGALPACLLTFFIASIAMFVRQRLGIAHVHPMINVSITAFVATLGCGLVAHYIDVQTPSIALASCILLLVPGFPLINAVSDIFKGHVNTGVARWVIASALALTTSIGIVMALALLGMEQW